MVKRNFLACVLQTLLFSLLDVGTSFIGICFHGSSPSTQHFRDEFAASYAFNRSVREFFFLSLIRTVFLISGCLILSFKTDRVSCFRFLKIFYTTNQYSRPVCLGIWAISHSDFQFCSAHLHHRNSLD